MSTQLLAQLRQLKLSGMAHTLQTQQEQTQQEQTGTYESLPFVERLGLQMEKETLSREQRKHGQLAGKARFKLAATVHDIDYQHPRNISQTQIARLALGDWSR
ncbi:ATP-binding protein [uncultured Oceanisphaera sp.]|uniref:ATP-binding protein n=1 Tax=uncultured Oceanisphaera sp. TaxID=353858 RepID=UPI00260292EA|nr:ATP-binding protein [uncultured Oceanisphaera sp.]